MSTSPSLSPPAFCDPERLLPPNRSSFRADETGRMFHCSTNHISKLIANGEISVPQENIEKAKSQPCIQIPREALVDFLRRRMMTPERLAEKSSDEGRAAESTEAIRRDQTGA